MIFQETDDLILVNIDDGSVSTSSAETVELPEVPTAAADCFTQRCPRSNHDTSLLLPKILKVDNVALAPAGAPPWRSTLTCTSVNAQAARTSTSSGRGEERGSGASTTKSRGSRWS